MTGIERGFDGAESASTLWRPGKPDPSTSQRRPRSVARWAAVAVLLFAVGLGGGTTLALYLLSGNDSAPAAVETEIRDPALDSEALTSSQDLAAIYSALEKAWLGDYAAATTELAVLAAGDGGEATTREALFLLARTQYESGDVASASGTLDSYINAYPEGPDVERSLLLRAEARTDLGLLEDASSDLTRYVELKGKAGSYALMRLGDIALESGAPVDAVAAYEGAIGHGLPAYVESRLMFSLVDLYDGLGDLASARGWAERLAITTPSTRDRTNALRRGASLARAMGDEEAWVEMSTQLVTQFPAYAVAAAAMQDLKDAGHSMDPFLEAALYGAQGQPGSAEGILLNLVTQGDSLSAGHAAYELGVLREFAGDDEGALAWFEQAGEGAPEYAADLDRRRSEAGLRLDKVGAAADLDAFVGSHPGSVGAYSGAVSLAVAAEAEGGTVAAEAWLRALSEAAASGQLDGAIDAGRRAAELFVEIGDDDRALETLSAVASIDPGSFGSLRAEVELTELDDKAVLPAYYGEREATTWLRSFATDEVGAGSASAASWETGRELWALGLRREGTSHLRDVAALSRYEPGLLVRVSASAAADGQIPIASRAGGVLLEHLPPDVRNEIPRSIGVLAYPRPYLDIAEVEADNRDLDPLLLYAVIRQESFFDPKAYSSAQARGLTQVIPSTASGIAAQLEVADFSVERLYEPPLSLQFGAYYLGAQMEAFDDYPYAALAAYNGGPGNAQRWGAEGGFEDPDVFVARIDFRETINYVRMVMEHYANYRALYGGESRPTLRGLE